MYTDICVVWEFTVFLLPFFLCSSFFPLLYIKCNWIKTNEKLVQKKLSEVLLLNLTESEFHSFQFRCKFTYLYRYMSSYLWYSWDFSDQYYICFVVVWFGFDFVFLFICLVVTCAQKRESFLTKFRSVVNKRFLLCTITVFCICWYWSYLII